MGDLGLKINLEACGPLLVKRGNQAVCPKCGATFSALRMVAAIAAGDIRVDIGGLQPSTKGAGVKPDGQ